MVAKFGFEVAFGNLRKGNFSLLARRLMDKVGQGAAPRRKLERRNSQDNAGGSIVGKGFWVFLIIIKYKIPPNLILFIKAPRVSAQERVVVNRFQSICFPTLPWSTV